MHEEYCNCAMNWKVGGICHYYSNSIFNEAGELYDGKEEYFIIFKNYISNTQNDKVLLKFLKENYYGYYCCYFNIAIFLIKQIYGDYQETSDRDLKAFVISYLKWSYGFPYDENNKLRRNLEGIEMQNKCYCTDALKNKICHTYIKNLIREDGTLYNKNDEIHLEMLKDYISMKKNDKVLFDFIKENCEEYKMCYYDIAVFIMWKIFNHFDIHMRKDIIIFMISYLYWSYGNPDDTDNLLRKHFVKEEMKECKCNCKKCFIDKCYDRCNGFSLTDYYLKSHGVFGIRGEWRGYARLYTDFIDPGKDDETLRDLLSRNYNGEFCYLKIAKWIVKKTKRHLYYVADDEEDLIDCIMSYLYWSYGAPYDEDNNVLKVMIDMEKIRRKKRKEKTDNWLLKNNNIDISNYKYKPKEKKESNNTTTKSGCVRDARVRGLALQLANFQCEIDKEHDTFISKATLRNYVESHHLIPMNYYHSNEFKYSIDNEADIVALCPNCHSLLHFGRFEDKKVLLEKLYYKHIESLKKAEIEITLERLLEMYEN